MRYLITGAKGYIGSMLIAALLQEKSSNEIIAITRNIVSADNCYRVKWICGDITEKVVFDSVDGKVDYIIHCASETKSKMMVEYPVETSYGIVEGTYNVLNFAKERKVKSVVMLSSFEVYGYSAEFDEQKVTETCIGKIDSTNPRSSYPLGKNMAEGYCYFFAKEYSVPAKVVRLAQVFGKGVAKDDSRIFAQIARCVIDKRDIVLNTDGQSIGNYCDIEEAVKGILLVLHKGKDGECYNIVNEDNTMSIKAMATLVAKHFTNNNIKVITKCHEKASSIYPHNTNVQMSSERIRKLGWEPHKSLVEMYDDLIETYAYKAGRE